MAAITIEKDSVFMNSAFGTMNKILKVIERSMDDDTFDLSLFNAKAFSISENRFARMLKMLSDSGYIEGIKVEDFGEPDACDSADYKRFRMIIGNISITIKGLQFLAENSTLASLYKTVKNVKDLLP